MTESRLRRKRIQKEDKMKKWRRSIELSKENKEPHDNWASKKRAEIKNLRKASKVEEVKPVVK